MAPICVYVGFLDHEGYESRKQARSWFRTGEDYRHVSLSTTGTGTIVHVWGYDGQNSSCFPPHPDSTQLACPLWSYVGEHALQVNNT